MAQRDAARRDRPHATRRRAECNARWVSCKREFCTVPSAVLQCDDVHGRRDWRGCERDPAGVDTFRGGTYGRTLWLTCPVLPDSVRGRPLVPARRGVRSACRRPAVRVD